MIYWCTMKTHVSQDPPPVSAWMEDALAMMELSAEVTAGLAQVAAGNSEANNAEPEPARAVERGAVRRTA